MPYYGDNMDVVPPHWHNHMELMYSEAEGTININDKAYEIKSGDIFFVNPGSIHRTYRKTAGLMIHIVFDIDLLRTSPHTNPCTTLINEIVSQNKKFKETVKQDTELYNELLPPILNIIKKYRERAVSFGAESYDVLSQLFMIISAAYRANHFEDVSGANIYGMRYITESINYIEKHYHENITIAELAQNVNISETYLFRLFREYVGVTPINYLNSVRLRAAYRLLDEGKSVTETALLIGIPSISYFIKLFKSATGSTPKSWLSARNKK